MSITLQRGPNNQYRVPRFRLVGTWIHRPRFPDGRRPRYGTPRPFQELLCMWQDYRANGTCKAVNRMLDDIRTPVLIASPNSRNKFRIIHCDMCSYRECRCEQHQHRGESEGRIDPPSPGEDINSRALRRRCNWSRTNKALPSGGRAAMSACDLQRPKADTPQTRQRGDHRAPSPPPSP